MSNLAEMLNDASIDRILAFDRHWKITAWNKSSEKGSGIQREAILGKPVLEIFPSLREDQDMMNAMEKALQGYSSFLPAKQDAFHRHYYENYFIPVFDEEGKITGVVNIMHDASYRIKAEERLEKLNAELKEKFKQLERANAELATFTSITGNDLKEPLKKIYTSLELIIKNDGPRFSDSSKAALRRMQASINRINFLLDDVLALSTANTASLEFTHLDTESLVRSVVEGMHKKVEDRNAVIKLENLPPLYASAQMLHYLFHNLIDNALKFQPSEQQPFIVISGSSVKINGKGAETETPMIKISISDNGIGFEQDDAEKVFQLFEKLPSKQKFPGSGIGLAICKKIMEAHNGFIEATSTPGEGSRFDCYFPTGY